MADLTTPPHAAADTDAASERGGRAVRFDPLATPTHSVAPSATTGMLSPPNTVASGRHGADADDNLGGTHNSTTDFRRHRDSLNTVESSAFFSDPMPGGAESIAASPRDLGALGAKVIVDDDGEFSFAPVTDGDAGVAGSDAAASTSNMTYSDASVLVHSAKAKAMDKSFVDVAAQGESRRADEFERKNVALQRAASFIPVNPYEGDAVEMPDPQDDAIMGVVLNEQQMVERRQAQEFQQANHTKLEHHAVAGYNFNAAARGNRAINIMHVDEDSICFPSGRHLHVAKLLDPSAHRVQPRTARCVEIVAFSVSSNGKYIAIAERMAAAPHVTIYKADSNTKIASLNFKNLTTTYVSHIAFSSNNNFLLCATAQPNQRLVMWQLSDVKVVGVLDDVSIQTHAYALPGRMTAASSIISCIAVNPWSSFAIANASDQGMSLWRLSGRSFTLEAQVSTVAAAGSNGAAAAMGANLNAQGGSAPAPGLLRPVVSLCWYDEICCAGLTHDGYLIAIEDRTVKQRLKLRVPPPPAGAFAPTAAQLGSGSPDMFGGSASPSPKGIDATGGFASFRGSTAHGSPASLELGGTPGAASIRFNASMSKSPNSAATQFAPPPMHFLAWASRGLLCCGADGTIVLLDRTYAEPCFVQTCVIRIGLAPCETGLTHFPAVRTCSVSPGETNVVLGLSDNTIVCFAMDDLNDALTEAERLDEERQVEAMSVVKSMMPRRHTDLFESTDELDIGATGGRPAIMAPTPGPFGPDNNNDDRSRRTSYQQHRDSAAVLSGSPERVARQMEVERLQQGVVMPGMGVAFYQPAFIKRVEHLCFHFAPITSISTCVQRPLVATTSADKTLRVYNYESNTFTHVARMEDEVLCGALHPTGLFVVLCFRFYTRVYALLPRGLHLVDDINVKPANEVRFSNGGGRIAFAVNNRVILADAHTYRIVGGLVGHASNIKSISFSPHDDTITTCDVAGIVLTWNAATFERYPQESSQKNLIFQQVFMEEQTGLFCGFGSSKHARGTTYEGEVTLVCCKPSDDKSIVYVRPGMVLPKNQATRKTHFNLMLVIKSTSTLIVGTPTGRLLVYTWPLLKTSKPYCAIDNHCTEITHILLSPDERFLFTVGGDCVMYTYDLLHMREGRYVSATTFNWSIFDPVVLQHASDADQIERDTFTLRMKLEAKTREYEESLASIKRTRELEIKACVARHEREIERLRKEIDTVVSAMKAHEKATTERAHQVEASHASAAEEIEVLYSKRAREAIARINRIESEREELAAQFEGQIAAKQYEIAATRQRMQARIAERERALRNVIAKHHAILRENVKKQDAMLAQTIADYETQLKQMDTQHRAALESNDERTMRAANTASFGDREAERLRRDIVDLQDEVQKKVVVAQQLQAVMVRKDKENKVLKKELLVKQEAINQSEKRMLNLKQQLSKLENLRFVLTHQYEELRRAYIPKDSETHALEARIRTRETDLQSLSFERNQVKEQVQNVDARLETLQGTSGKLRVKALDQDRRAKVMLESLGRLLDNYTDGHALMSQLRDLVGNIRKSAKETQEFVSEAELESAKRGHTNAEIRHQVEFLEAKLAGLRKAEGRFDADTATLNGERIESNTAMIEEIRAMRRERKDLLSKCNLMEQQLRDTCVALHRLADPRRAVATGPSAATLALQQEIARSNAAMDPPPPLLPPIDRSTSRGGALVPVADHEDGASRTRPASSMAGTVSTAASRKSLQDRKGLPSRSQSSTPQPSTKHHNSSSMKGTPTPGKQPAAVPIKKSRAAQVFERAHLDSVMGSLDAATDRMRHQQDDVRSLRSMVQELLAAEEARLIEALGKQQDSVSSPPMSPTLARGSPSPSPTRAQAAAARAASAFSFGPTPGLDDDADDGVDWSVPNAGAPPSDDRNASARPMTPTRLPAAGGL